MPKNEHDDTEQWTPRYAHNQSQPHTYLMFFWLSGPNIGNTAVVVHQKGVSIEII